MIREKTNKLLIITFIVIILTPAVIQITGIEHLFLSNQSATLENRFSGDILIRPKSFIKDIKTYYSNNFGGRNSIYLAYKKFTQNALKENPLPDKVVQGSNGWLFLGNSFSDAYSESLGYKQFSKNELQQIANKIKHQREWLEERSIQYYISVAPNKHTVYKEYLPFKSFKVKTRLQALKEYLKEKINFELIDLKENIIPIKDSINLYHKFDSHWNDHGAFLGYEKLMDNLQLKNQIIKKQRMFFSDIVLDTIINEIGGLNKVLMNTNREEWKILKKKQSDYLQLPDIYIGKIDDYENRFLNKTKKLKILIFRDSFSIALQKYINETFGETVLIWNFDFDKDLIEKEQPDIVLYEVVERYLEKLKD